MRILEGNKRDAVRGLLLTVILGICFTAIQAYEYFNAPFGFRDNIYSSTFFMATGFHGFHVLVGTTFLLVCLFRAMAGQFKPKQHFGFEAAAWYWHFVDVVWLFLFFCIYWWGAGNAPIAPALRLAEASMIGTAGRSPAVRFWEFQGR